MDMGGTSTDISLVLDGRPQVTREAALDGIPVRIPVIDINAIGAGGGSIAWIDEGGALRVGPSSAEAVPGPACYGRGGAEPTVTDANLVLGRLGGDTRLGGELTLDAEAATRASYPNRGTARPRPDRSGIGHPACCDATMARGIRVVSVERGHDPRRLTLVPFGGPARCTARPWRASWRSAPAYPADPRHLVRARHAGRRSAARSGADPPCRAPRSGAREARALFDPMLAEARRLLDADRVPDERRRIEMRLDMRYVGQSYDLPIPIAGFSEAEWAPLVPAFHHEHARRFGHGDPGAPVEIVSFAVTATGLIDTPELPRPPQGRPSRRRKREAARRRAYFEAGEGGAGWAECPVWRREALLAGNGSPGRNRRGNLGYDGALSGPPRPCRCHGSPVVEVGA